MLVASAAILTALAAKLFAVNRWDIGGVALLILLVTLDLAVVLVHHLSH